jgi:hypothetical protein
MIESTTSGSRIVPGIGAYADETSANGHANVHGLETYINQMLAEDYIRCLSNALDQLLAKFNNNAGVSLLRPSCLLQYSVQKFYKTSVSSN